MKKETNIKVVFITFYKFCVTVIYVSIIKIKKRENPYVQIDKRIYDDASLSWKAKGVLSYLLSKPDNWTIRVTDIIKKSTDGRDSVYSALRELRKAGYLLKAPIRDEKGKITEWIEELYEEPNQEAKEVFEKQQKSRKKSKEKNPLTENTEMELDTDKPFTEKPYEDKPNMEKPYEEKPEILIKEISNNKDINNIDVSKKERSTIHNKPIQSFLDAIRKDMTDVSYKTWIEPLEINIEGSKVILKTKDSFSKQVIEERFLDVIKAKAIDIGLRKVDIV